MAVDNTRGYQTIDSWIKGLRSLPGMMRAAPAQLVPVVKSECDSSISAGQSLDGVKWAEKVGGGQALQGTAKDLSVKASGNIIWIIIKGGLVWSQFGTKHQRRRQVLPVKGLPMKLGNAIRNGIIDMAPEFLSRKGGHHKATKGIRWQ